MLLGLSCVPDLQSLRSIFDLVIKAVNPVYVLLCWACCPPSQSLERCWTISLKTSMLSQMQRTRSLVALFGLGPRSSAMSIVVIQLSLAFMSCLQLLLALLH